MKEDIIFNAIGDIDDDLIEKADSCTELIKINKRKKNKTVWSFISVLIVIVSAFFIIIMINTKINVGNDDKIDFSKYLLKERQTLENIWENGQLKVYTISKEEQNSSIKGQASFLAASQVLTPENITLKGLKNLTIEAVFGDYYILAYEDFYKLVVYNLKTGERYDLFKLLLKDKYFESNVFGDHAIEMVEKKCPELLSSDINRQYIWYCGLFHAEINTIMAYDKMRSLIKDVDPTPLIDDYKMLLEHGEDRFPDISDYFEEIIVNYVCQAIDEIRRDNSYSDYIFLKIISLDSNSGKIYYRKEGNNCDEKNLYCYDFETNTEKLIKVDARMFVEASDKYYETNGTKLFVTEPLTYFNKESAILDYKRRERNPDYMGNNPDYNHNVFEIGYKGEYFYVLDFNEKNKVFNKDDAIFGMGPFLVSNNGKILAYRYFTKGYHFSTITTLEKYYNRVNSTSTETQWVFQLLNNDNGYSIVLDGEFVRYASNGNVVIIRKGGKCKAYFLSLEVVDQGTDKYESNKNEEYIQKENITTEKDKYELVATDITEKILRSEYFLYSHEYFDSYIEGNNLIRVNLFTGKTEVISENVDACTFSKGKSFAFVFSKEEKTLYCYNVATLERCKIVLDESFVKENDISKYNSVSLLFNDENCTLTVYYSFADSISNSIETDYYDQIINIMKRYEEEMAKRGDETEPPTEPITEQIE